MGLWRKRVHQEWIALFELKKTERLWHIPVLASICVGVPLVVGYLMGALDSALIACLGGLVILYLPSTSIANRVLTVALCSFGLMCSYALGIVFSFHPVVSGIALGIFAGVTHWLVTTLYVKPPGNFFFIMFASIASCSPFELTSIPLKMGLIGMGTLFATLLAWGYSLWIVPKFGVKKLVPRLRKNNYDRITESAIMGIFIGGSLLVAHIFSLENPYWVPISCLAVMQGVTTKQIWQRSFQRILGTVIGMGLAWLFLLGPKSSLTLIGGILVLQFIVEMLIVRHYGLAVIFITPLTLFLADANSAISQTPNELIAARLMGIVVGSLIGAVGGYFLYHQKIKKRAKQQLRKTTKVIRRWN
jgi:hypothetical protein